MAYTIRKLEDLLQIKKDDILNCQITSLTAPGDNYGSLMLSVDVTVKTPKETEEIHVVAKMLPPNKQMQDMFNSQITFRNEIAFYKTIVPTLQNLQRDNDISDMIDLCPKYYGSRFSLDPANPKIDSDGVLLLENLKISDYVLLDRIKGVDLDVAKLVIIDLALLHAVPLALKLKQPKIFERDVKQYLRTLELTEELCKSLEKKCNRLIDSMDECKPFLDRIRKFSFENMFPSKTPREPFATFCHNDCWVNNIMVQFKDGKPIKSKFVDFQLCDYGSPAKDVIFFLFTSVQDHVIQKNYDELIRLYHNTFTSILLELKCDASKFSFEAFQKELDCEAKNTQFVHVVLMFFPIFTPKEKALEASELKPTDIGRDEPTPEHKRKLIFVLNEFAKRNWI